jgi:choline dehydrogenase-like flavoprotein
MALTRAGHAVTMLDAGLELEQERRSAVNVTSAQAAAEWSESAIKLFRENMHSAASGIPLKYTYGSNFPYRLNEQDSTHQTSGMALLPSLAKGGLSNVWGSAVLPYIQQDIENWPVRIEDLDPHYRSVLSFMPLAGTTDGIAERFPLYTDKPNQLSRSRQARDLLATLETNRSKLREEGILFGSSRIAVAASNRNGFACAACGLCMYGCPYELIYNSRSTLEELKRNPLFTYISGFRVHELLEEGAGVSIRAAELTSGEERLFRGSRVFMATGVIPTTRIILNSLKAFDTEVTLKDSQYFLLPVLRFRGAGLVTSEELHTLSQLFMEIFDPKVSEKSIHLQIYTYNDLFKDAITASLRATYKLFRPFEYSFLSRFLLIQGYLHSELSGSINVQLKHDSNARGGTLIMKGVKNDTTGKVISRLIAKLRRNARRIGGIPLASLLKIGEPGRGFHSGGSLPMSNSPGKLETDVYGRPFGFKRVHVADATSFPSIPASTITFSAMANAHRIASTFPND